MHVGRYQLVRKLATGGMAEVFLAKVAGPGGFEKTLVLKRILPHLVEDTSFVEMFLEEARLVAQLNHPHIVQIFDFGEAEGSYFLAMELIDGPNLRRWQRQAASRGRPLAPNICAKVVALAAEGLAYAHDFADPGTGQPLGLIHRDVSPDNILVSRQGAVKVVDFGIAKVAGQKHRTQTGIVKGKVAYMPPEQCQADPLDRRVDVYALGVVLYELLTGRLPFEGATELAMMQSIVSRPPAPVSRHRADVPSALQDIISTALEKDRERRYPNCRALQADLERFVLSTGEPVGAYQIAQSVELVVEERATATPAPITNREAERTAPSGPAREERAEASDAVGLEQTTPQRPHKSAGATRGKKLVPVAVTGAVLLLAGGGYALLGRAPSGPEVRGVETKPTEEVAPVPSDAKLAEAKPTDAARPLPSDVKPTEGAQPEPSDVKLAQGEEVAPRPTEPSAPDEDDDLLAPMSGTAEGTARKDGSARAVKGATGTVEFRIRPYAVVYLDGKKLGETPLGIIDVPEGSHTVTAVNSRLGKRVTRSFEVKAGTANVFKLNLTQQ
ncbi:protein kinase [Myxococcus sp. K38C18041901]|uniref:serine/threonine protein kinase n=1 Tax=Myxococcus guangdongensis TaxID=2906760 RepID=UPI0020A7064B|nr:serine/threonine-protein kinase [Myxococcus guangdongensis]MCP3063372.1 protein kinase [Myxococcus guangdongensis]